MTPDLPRGRACPVVWALLHDLGRTGVPVALERLIRWQGAVDPDAADIHVIAGRDGALRSALAVAAASVTTFEPAEGRRAATTAALALTEAGRAEAGRELRARWARRQVRRLPAPDVVLVQGAGAWRTFTDLEPRIGSARVVVHLHELAVAFARSGLGTDTDRIVQRPDAVLAVCGAVADLAVAHGADPASIRLVPGTVDPPPAGWSAPLVASSSRDLVSIGTAGWRKGTDLATAAAHELHRLDRGTAWHWIGEPEPSAWAWAVGAADPLVRHGASSAPWQVVPAAAALVVPSREDPLPLVALEAGARGIPVVAARTGGLTDLLADGRGRTVDPTDVAGLVAAVRSVLDDPAAAARRAAALRDHVRRDHASGTVGPRWLEALLGP
ncbi:MAG: glycosyl transferase [Ilumatobacteraceae bacterium]|nr:glycosyl transferase [Ilumatobacteraceae bacterium]